MKTPHLICLLLIAALCSPNQRSAVAAEPNVLRPDNLVAWCIVPFDAAKRSPTERAGMLKELGLTRCAYDWRGEHVATFEEEIKQYQKHGIEFFAFWSEHEQAFELFEKYEIHPQIWKTLPSPPGETQAARVAAAAKAMLPLAERTKKLGCKLGLYNHGGWGGEPANLVAVCEKLRSMGHEHVGIVYNFHHGHGHIKDWPVSLKAMQPYLHCLNLNGMNDGAQPKILGIGKGQHEEQMIRAIVASGYDGPIGVLDHRNNLDAKESLQENLDGLKVIREKLAAEAADPQAAAPYDPTLAARLAEECKTHGDPLRGASVFASAKLACISCHKVGEQGGTVGPELAKVCKDRKLTELVESVIWPQRNVKPEYQVWKALTTEGQVLSGYKTANADGSIIIRDPAKEDSHRLTADDIDALQPAGSPMPNRLADGMSYQQQLDLYALLDLIRRHDATELAKLETVIKHAQHHGPATFPYDRGPLHLEDWPSWQEHVNRDRVYDFYTKQAEHFRQQHHTPMLLAPYPGLDDGKYGHWGNQKEEVWADGRWNSVDLGSMQAGVFKGDGKTIARGVCLRLGDRGEMATCFNPDTLRYEASWSGGFLKFSSVRHGFLHGLLIDGKPLPINAGKPAEGKHRYLGYDRVGQRVVFAYEIDGKEYLDSAWVENGQFTREVAPRDKHSLAKVIADPKPQWPETMETKIVNGKGSPYAIDRIELPTDNPWNALIFCGGHDFLPDGSALVCTMHGDVWHVNGLETETARWRRFASGLHHPLGLVVHEGEIFVQCRDQLMRLHDLNGDGEADYYECFSNAFRTSAAGHDYICGLQRDADGNFYTASGNQGLVQISADGSLAHILATGFRNPDGLGLYPDGTVTVPCSEGSWTPASMICAVQPFKSKPFDPTPHFGHGGPRNNQPPALPMVYLPRGLDNSSGGQVYVSSDRWGPLQGKMVHLSFGAGSHHLLLRDEVDGRLQGAIVPLAGEFRSGAHRGRFNPKDGQLYVSGMAGWGSYTPDDGCLTRVRYTGDPVQMPIGFHVHNNGVRIEFSQPLEAAIAEDLASHFAQCWNYRFSKAYGSPEYSPSHYGMPGHDPVAITSAHVLADGKTLFLELPDLQPVNQLHLRMHVDSGEGHDMFATVHALDDPFTGFPGYRSRQKLIAAHPILADMAYESVRQPNPWRHEIKDARSINIAAAKNLSYATREITASPGEAIKFTFTNPDVVPHNWALLKPGTLESVGDLANRLVSDPDAVARHYIPKTDNVLAFTDVVWPGKQFTIYFRAPDKPGRYPYLCTMPGHWRVMNGVLIVE